MAGPVVRTEQAGRPATVTAARLEAEESGSDTMTFDPLLLETENPVAAELMQGSERLFRARLETAER